MSESQLQSAVVSLARRSGHLVVMVNNSQGRSARQGAILKRLGMHPGASDIVIIGKEGKTLWMELKAPNGDLRLSQEQFASDLAARGHTWACVRSVDQAAKVIKEWAA